MADRRHEFYVGYEPRGPRALARRMRVVVALSLAAGLALAVVLTATQRPFDVGVFEFGVDREFVGTIVEAPYPLLLVGGRATQPAETYLLIGSGKHGANAWVASLDGRTARVSGSLISNDHRQMIEVHGIEPLGREATRVPGREFELGQATLVGEIVDSKCFLGVMKPGRGKTHKACAVRCISGGSPPLLRVEDSAGRVDLFLLLAVDGSAVNDQVLSMVAEPVEITGRIARLDELLVLYADPENYRRFDR